MGIKIHPQAEIIRNSGGTGGGSAFFFVCLACFVCLVFLLFLVIFKILFVQVGRGPGERASFKFLGPGLGYNPKG